MVNLKDVDPALYYLTVPYLIFGIVIVCENALCLLVICKSKIICQAQSSKYLFTASLGVTDLFTGMVMVAMAMTFAPSLAIRQHVSKEMAISLGGAACAMFLESILHMAVVALERYLFIAHPFYHQKHVTSRKIKAIICLSWFLGLVVLLVLICKQVQIVGVVNGEPNTNWDFLVQRIYSGIYALLTIIAFVSYLLILLQVRKHRHTLSTLGGNTTIPRWKEQVKSLKFFMTVFGFYFVTTCPIVVVISLAEELHMSVSLQYAFGGIAMINSAMNFVILYIIDSKYKWMVKSFISKCQCKDAYEVQ